MIDLKVAGMLLILALDFGFVLGVAWASLHANRAEPAEPVPAVDEVAARRARVSATSTDHRKRAA